MIIDLRLHNVSVRRVETINHLNQLGYNVASGDNIRVPTHHLYKGSSVRVQCICDACTKQFDRPYWQVVGKTFLRCEYCADRYRCETRKFDYTKRQNKYYSGEDHHNWNPNKSEYKKYKSRVMYYTRKSYKEHKSELNPNNYKLAIAGTLNGFQIDHIIPIKYGFDNNLPPETVGHINNLRIVTWKENRDKWFYHNELQGVTQHGV